MDAITAIGQRIAAIEAGFAALATARPAPMTSFATTLASAGGPAPHPAGGPAPAADSLATAAWAATLRGSSPATTADGVPAELAAYGNGRIPAAALEPVGETGHRLWRPAADAFERLHAAAAADGVSIGVTDSYRSYDAQVDVVRRKGLYSEGGLGAEPGTSRHGWGMAVDLDLDAEALAWMRSNAGRFGFVEDTPREPWHWGYQGD